jgi:indole-3-glycerol phosphate synthase
VVRAERDDDDLVALADRAIELGMEVVVRVCDEDDLERVLEQLDPEIVLLAADKDTDASALEQLLELLPDVPAGKLAIAALPDASRADVEELERAGVDAVVVQGDIAALAGDEHPEV